MLKNIRLTCDDAIPEKDTYKDLCNDKNYFLRRLQTFDNKLFKYDIKDKKAKQYSKCCQSTHPVVLPYDPSKNKSIHQDSYTESIKYGSTTKKNWYICPKIWCSHCEIPLSESEIESKTIKTRNNCKTAKCPYGDHQVFIREKKNKTYAYPDGLSLPCCFLKSKI